MLRYSLKKKGQQNKGTLILKKRLEALPAHLCIVCMLFLLFFFLEKKRIAFKNSLDQYFSFLDY